MTKAILKLLNIQNAKEAQEEWTESLKSKFKRERYLLQETYEEVQKMKMKCGNTSGRPIKRRTNEVAPRREVNIIFDEIQYLCRVNIDENVTTMLPKLFQNMSDNSGYVTELLTIRLIKLLSKHFTDSWEYILTEKEPLSPCPTIQVITDKFRIFLDYELITETTSVDRALAAIISLYVVFDLQFGVHNRTIHLLYGVLLQEPAALTKQLRNLLIEWKFKIKHKELRQAAIYIGVTTDRVAEHPVGSSSSFTTTPPIDNPSVLPPPLTTQQSSSSYRLPLSPLDGNEKKYGNQRTTATANTIRHRRSNA
ncbi:unnamed protein product, partial [Didymodactylos carnosus]